MDAPKPTGSVTRVLTAGSAYFGMIFILGFALGVVRVLITAPRLGVLGAVVLELPIILAASWLAARFCVARFAVGPHATQRLSMGAIAFCLTIAAECALSVFLFRRPPGQFLALYVRDLAGAVGLGGQVLFALIPYIQSISSTLGRPGQHDHSA